MINGEFERIWNEPFVTYPRHDPSAYMEGLRKPRNASIRIVGVWQRFEMGSPEYKSLSVNQPFDQLRIQSVSLLISQSVAYSLTPVT
jgi:hypothetical protein